MLKKIILTVCMAVASFCAQAVDKTHFYAWLNELKAEAKADSISPKTIKSTFKNAKYLPQVIVLDRAQPEFISPFLSYIDRRVTPDKIAQGRAMLQQHETLLSRIETQYGVPKQILVAFWGLETHYGENQGGFGLPSALMTLAYEGRRAEFFRGQLLDAMRIVDAGHNNVAGMRGSWAGAMGHMQFMPSTMLKHGVDADGDGRINIWTSLPDAFASAANYLEKTGWRKGGLAMSEVKLPEHFDYSLAHLLNRKSTADWSKLGVVDIDGNPLPVLDNAAILLPQGWQGPAFMVFSNFDVIMDWNRSVNYALSVAHLANQFVGDKPIMAGLEAEGEALTFNQMWALQGKLNELGFDCGAPDGFPGFKTQAAIRQYQATKNLPQDGYASPSLYQQLLQP
ncbi:MAG TPA: lytic murein transglycosylase [Methylotenera sp.]|nr:lytic murein transglycosylase [Methylotenera sp.]HPV44019.1 lytic murein transglycosylase [Methylotenera sp.]